MDEPRQHNDGLSRRKEIFGVPFQDVAHQSHEDRIALVVNKMRDNPAPDFKMVFFTDSEGKDGFEKADWYIRGILALDATLKCERKHGPTPGCVTIFITRKQPHKNN